MRRAGLPEKSSGRLEERFEEPRQRLAEQVTIRCFRPCRRMVSVKGKLRFPCTLRERLPKHALVSDGGCELPSTVFNGQRKSSVARHPFAGTGGAAGPGG